MKETDNGISIRDKPASAPPAAGCQSLMPRCLIFLNQYGFWPLTVTRWP
jgi:hypothetical protein